MEIRRFGRRLASIPTLQQSCNNSIDKDRRGIGAEKSNRTSANQAQAFVEFLTAQESLLKRISSYEKENAKQALRKIYRLIAAYGRRIREGKRREGRESIEGKESKIIPTPILNGSYFTVYQAAQVYRSTSKEIRAWIRKGKLEALNLPDLGIVIEAEKLNEFLYEIRSIQDAPRPERSHEP